MELACYIKDSFAASVASIAFIGRLEDLSSCIVAYFNAIAINSYSSDHIIAIIAPIK